jgi:hypothetical protein
MDFKEDVVLVAESKACGVVLQVDSLYLESNHKVRLFDRVSSDYDLRYNLGSLPSQI